MYEPLITDLVQIRQLAEAKQEENLRFRRYLKQRHCPERQLEELAREVEHQINCTACANCCRETVVEVSGHDIDAIAVYLQITPEVSLRQYTVIDEASGERILRQTEGGCVFLDGNFCLVYDARPKACRKFPHLTESIHTPAHRIESACRRAPICPIVYNSLERYKHLAGFHPEHSRSTRLNSLTQDQLPPTN